MAGRLTLGDIGWDEVVSRLTSRGWVRLEGAVGPDAAAALEHAAPGPWCTLPETEGGAGVRQAGQACHRAVEVANLGEAVVEVAADVVASLAEEIEVGIDGVAAVGVAPLPAFNHVEWCRPDRGRMFITPHRDPDTAGGVIAVLTLRGRATFRVWESAGSLAEATARPDLADEWQTGDGDLVLLRGGGWPTPASRCPIHAAETPVGGDRTTLTLRHNKGGYGTDYFA